VKSTGVTMVGAEKTNGDSLLRGRVVLMPCIRSRLAASLATRLQSEGAWLVRGYSDFDSLPGYNLQIDTRHTDGLVAFYREAAAQNSRIDLCVHCLGIERTNTAEERSKNRLDARTIFLGTLLALRHLNLKADGGTILNVAMIGPVNSIDAGMAEAAANLVIGVTRYAATFSPGKILAFAPQSNLESPQTVICSGSASDIHQVCFIRLRSRSSFPYSPSGLSLLD
jgi:NAD(P)-dependent dehydrogenase (short-subunit alcohol dehydrogenase family)